MAELLSARVKDSAWCSCDRIALGICPSLAVALQAVWTVRMSVEKNGDGARIDVCGNDRSVWGEGPQKRSFDFRNYSAILFCPFFDVVGVCLCEILPCFCMVVNLEKSSF
jgi:hypothetical protein